MTRAPTRRSPTTNSVRQAMVNDVALTNDAAWLTDSFRAVLYRIPLARNGTLVGQSDVQEVSLTGDFELAGGFNANGIDATPDGKTLIAVQTNLAACTGSTRQPARLIASS